MTDPASFIGKYYKMDPQLEDLIYGADLENGMEILIETPDRKVDLASWTNTDSKTMLEFLEKQSGEFQKQAETWNRWVLVTKLQKHSPASITFIGMFSDGTKQTFTTLANVGWYVKKASIPVIPTDIQEGLEAKVYEVVKNAMLKQDSALYHGAPFDILEASKVLTKQVSGLMAGAADRSGDPPGGADRREDRQGYCRGDQSYGEGDSVRRGPSQGGGLR